MEKINWFSTIGLILDIIGVLMLFKYGLPSKISDGDTLGIEESKEEEELRNNKNKYIIKMAYFGLSFILIGFVFQLIGTNISIFK
jgi:hypothetical protein